MVVFTPLLIAKAALNVTKAVADSQRTAPAPAHLQADYASLKGSKNKKPKQESQDQLKGQMNGKTQQGSLDKDGKFNLSDATPNDYRGGTVNYKDSKRDQRYGNPYT